MQTHGTVLVLFGQKVSLVPVRIRKVAWVETQHVCEPIIPKPCLLRIHFLTSTTIKHAATLKVTDEASVLHCYGSRQGAPVHGGG
jgi:hypothetical protein